MAHPDREERHERHFLKNFYSSLVFLCFCLLSSAPLSTHTPAALHFHSPCIFMASLPPTTPPRPHTVGKNTPHHVAPSTHHSNDVARSLFSKQTGGKATQDWVLSVRRNSGLPRVYTWPFYTLEGLSLAKSIGFL